mmetsp:Transcript_6127/g.10409  ORF Transcript_6127/g.10409 Transcript_6127/m.10409 type:complete len:89 (-) Transcript_6127:654-920(-)
MMIAIFPFYFVTLEQHYTGEMNFPPVNGVDEGSVAILFLCLYTGYIGNEKLWNQMITLPFVEGELPLNKVLLATVQFSIYPYALQAFY